MNVPESGTITTSQSASFALAIVSIFSAIANLDMIHVYLGTLGYRRGLRFEDWIRELENRVLEDAVCEGKAWVEGARQLQDMLISGRSFDLDIDRDIIPSRSGAFSRQWDFPSDW